MLFSIFFAHSLFPFSPLGCVDVTCWVVQLKWSLFPALWEHWLFYFSKVALKMSMLIRCFLKHMPLLSWHRIFPQREGTANGKRPSKSSYHVAHHITATVSHSLLQTWDQTRSNIPARVQPEMASSTTWQSLLRKLKTGKWSPYANYSVLSLRMKNNCFRN